MDEKDWLIIKLLYENKSVTQVAKTLLLTQPTISSRIKQIEKRFGICMFIRGGKGIQITPEGEFLAKQANTFLRMLRSVEESIHNMKKLPHGVLRIGASTFSSKYILPKILSAFKLKYPDVEFKVFTGYSRYVLQELHEGNLHLAFIRGEYDWPDKELLITEDMYVASLKPIDLKKLPLLPQVDYPKDYSVKLDLSRWWNEQYNVSPYIGIEVDNADTCKEMILENLGYSFLPELLVKDDSNFNLTKMIYKSGKSVRRNTWLFYDQNLMSLKIVKSFYDFVMEVKF